MRSLLYEAASVILSRSSPESTLRDWGLKLRERIGFKRAAVAVARKLAVIMHAMLKSGELLDKTPGHPHKDILASKLRRVPSLPGRRLNHSG